MGMTEQDDSRTPPGRLVERLLRERAFTGSASCTTDGVHVDGGLWRITTTARVVS